MLSNSMSFAVGAVVSAALFLGSAQAQTNVTTQYTVYASVVFARTGEHTPSFKLPGQMWRLTPYGAQQMANLGSFYRARYIGNGLQSQNPILGLSQDTYSELNLDIEAIDAQYAVGSAQAFMQAFYPPHKFNPAAGDIIDSDLTSSNGTYGQYPLGGYQYAMIETRSQYDPDSVWLNGVQSCTAANNAQGVYYSSPEANETWLETLPYYRSVGYQYMSDRSTIDDWGYMSAWSFYDTLDYLNRHNKTVSDALSANGTLNNLLPVFGRLAAHKQWKLYGDLTVSGNTVGDEVLAVGGKTLAAKILALLQDNVNSQGILQKFSLLVGEYQPMISLFSLLGLGDYNYGQWQFLPPYGSSVAFEVFTYENPADASIIPDPDKLWVRFMFRNASDPTSSDPVAVMPEIRAIPLFHGGPSTGSEIPWNDFVNAMTNISMNNIQDYCQTCRSATLYCSPFLTSLSTTSSSGKLSPAVGGVIGAVVTLIVAGLLFAALFFFAGMRLKKRENRRSELGGFKGSAKLASDADLSIPNNAAPFAGAEVESKKPGHERVGSWELNGNKETFGHQRFTSLGSTVVGRPSFERDEEMEAIHHTPTAPREHL